eukprot:459115-Alexandrium_andersonii.AAC.1
MDATCAGSGHVRRGRQPHGWHGSTGAERAGKAVPAGAPQLGHGCRCRGAGNVAMEGRAGAPSAGIYLPPLAPHNVGLATGGCPG